VSDEPEVPLVCDLCELPISSEDEGLFRLGDDYDEEGPFWEHSDTILCIAGLLAQRNSYRARLAACERVVEAARRWAAAQDDEYEITHELLAALNATPTTTEGV
jgi:hypothetical protein